MHATTPTIGFACFLRKKWWTTSIASSAYVLVYACVFIFMLSGSAHNTTYQQSAPLQQLRIIRTYTRVLVAFVCLFPTSFHFICSILYWLIYSCKNVTSTSSFYVIFVFMDCAFVVLLCPVRGDLIRLVPRPIHDYLLALLSQSVNA